MQGESAGQLLLVERNALLTHEEDEGRKVRAPQSRVPGNAWGVRTHGQCNRKYTALKRLRSAMGKGEMVR